jgi:hypothetical protein
MHLMKRYLSRFPFQNSASGKFYHPFHAQPQCFEAEGEMQLKNVP